ncbi:hypothetical protein GCM10027615_49710 [Plantactinospora veratri]
MLQAAPVLGPVDPYLIPALDGVAYGLLLFVAASGLVFCFGVANILNLAHGLLYAIGAYLAAAVLDGGWGACCSPWAWGRWRRPVREVCSRACSRRSPGGTI